MKCFNILCRGKLDCHNFIRREKKEGQRANFSVILKYVVFIVKKYCSFWLINLKRSSSNPKRVLPCCQIKKKFTEGNWRNRDKKIADKLTKSRFCKIKNCACENNICITATQKSSNGARAQRMKTISSNLKINIKSSTFYCKSLNLIGSLTAYRP